MRVHHVSCGTMCPLGARLVNGEGSLFARGRMVCHCLILETNDGLLLVDTGLGTADVADPKARLGRMFVAMTAPRLALEDTALGHVERLGFRREDVRHLVPTHLDLDHAGGLSDFPDAAVHLYAPEHAAAMARATSEERRRYRTAQWAHGPKWALHEVSGEKWFGFDAVRAVPGTADEVLLVPLVGHTRGHAGVAVRTANGWLLHAGDAYFFHGEMDPVAPHCTPGLAFFQRQIAVDDEARRNNQQRLRELRKAHGAEVTIFSAHCPVEFAALEAREKPASRARDGARVSAAS